MKIYTSNQREKEKNVYYKHEKEIGSLEDLLKAVRCDHIAVNEKDSRRMSENFISSDGVMMDLDNTHSQDPDDWRTLDDVTDTFPDIRFYYVKSRNYMRQKSKRLKSGETVFYEPREKYHLYFPLSCSIDQRNEYESLMLRTAGMFPYFDLGAAKPEQFFFGVAEPKGGYVPGDMCLDEFIAEQPAEKISETVQNFAAKYLPDANDETKKAISRLFSYLKIDNPMEEKPEPDQDPEELPEGIGWLDSVKQQKQLKWLEAWAKKHNVHLGRQFRLPSNHRDHPDAIAICVSCPWEDDPETGHSMNSPETSTVIMIELSGKLDFACKHSHGWKYGWKDFRAFHDEEYRNQDDGHVDEGYKEHKQLAKAGKPALILTDKLTVKSILPNYVEILRNDFNSKIWLNALDDRAMLTGMTWDEKTHPVRDVDLYRFVDYTAAKYGISNKDNTKMALAIVAQDNAYHPIVELLNNLSWDGQPRIAELFPRYLGAERTAYTTAATKLLLYGAIQRVFHPGIKFDYCIILADTIQGTGKSTMCRFLALNDDWFSDSLSDMGNDKTAYEALRGHWIVELGEMIATRRTKDIEQIKAYITREADDYRDPYGVFPERRPRQCIFVGTSNKPQFLPDDKTGNRRFIPILCDGKKADVHPRKNEAETRLYIQQVYAEALQTGAAEGWPLVLDPKFDDQLNAIREASTPDDPDLGLLQKWLDECGKQFVCSRLIWDEVFKGDQNRQPARIELQNISDLMNLKIVGWHKYSSREGKGKSSQLKFDTYGVQRAWERDPINKVINKAVNEVADDEFMTVSDSEGWPIFDESSS